MTALRTLLTGMASNSFKLISLASESTSLANALARTKANFDGNGSTFANDAAVSNGPMAGVGAATNATDVMFAFSGAGIHDSGKAALQGGGHTDSGDGSVYTFDPEAAAANINGGGSGTAWAMSLKSCRYIDAFTNGRPSAVTSPAGNQEDAPTTPGAQNEAYWLAKSADGVNMPGAGHTYHFNRFIPGTDWMLISQWGSMDPNQGGSPNAGYAYNIVTNTMVGPLITTAGMPANGGVTDYGYAQDNGGSATTMGVGSDGCAYSVAAENFADRLYQWTSPTTGALALVDTGAFSNTKQVNRQQAAALVFADPANPGQLIYFQHSYNPGDGGSDANFMVVTGLNGGTPTMTFHNYASGTVTTDGLGLIDYDYDTVRKKIVFTDGQHLFTVTPDPGGNLDGWVIAQITGFTGDTPPDASISGNSPFPSIRYITADDYYAHVYSGAYRIYKPAGWSPPSTGPAPYQGLLLAMWGWVGTQVTARAGAPVESLATANTTVTGDSGTPLEIIGTIAADIAARSESLAVAAKDSGAPVEALAGTRRDAAVPAEALGTIRADAGAPLEFLATLRVDAAAPNEWTTAVRIDGIATVETLGGVRGDGAAPDEALSALRRDAGAPSESLGTVRADGAAPIEGLAGVRGDAAAPEEFLGTAARDAGAPLEWSGAVSVTMDGVAPLEWVATARADTPAQAEALSSVRRDSAAYAEFLAGCVRDALAPTAFLAGISADVVGKIEFQTSLAGDAGGRLEWQGTIARDAGAPLEWVARLVADGAARIEWTGNIAAFTGDSALRLEWSATVRRDGFPAFEIQGAIPRFLFIVADAIASASIAGETIALPTIVNESLTAGAAASETLE